MMKISKVISEKNMGEYIIRNELVESPCIGDKDMEMVNYYSSFDGSYLGARHKGRVPFQIKWIKKYGATKFQKTHKRHTTASICYTEDYKGAGPAWIGYSHRAAVPFLVGDKIYQERHASGWPAKRREKISFNRHGSVTIKTMAQAKQAAKNFARSVS